MKLILCEGDLLDQDVDVIVNAWNRNIIPWWLLLPQGISGAIKRRGGTAPFRELATKGWLQMGDAVKTTAGTLPFKAIIHVAGINLAWRSSEAAIRKCVQNAMSLAKAEGYHSIGFPLIGAGTGGVAADRAISLMRETLEQIDFAGEVRIVRFTRT